MEMKKSSKKQFIPENNIFNVSNKSESRTAIFIAKIYLKNYENVEFHSLGEAIN